MSFHSPTSNAPEGVITYFLASNFLCMKDGFLTENLSLTRRKICGLQLSSPLLFLSSTEIISGDINYNVRLPFLKARLTGFFTQINNQTWARSFYHDEYRTFVNYMMTNVDQTFMGIEFGFESNITSTLQFTGAFTVGDYLYKSRPVATITRDNSQEVIALDKVIYLKNFKIGGMPQQASSLGLKYNSPKYWYAGINFNYFTDKKETKLRH